MPLPCGDSNPDASHLKKGTGLFPGSGLSLGAGLFADAGLSSGAARCAKNFTLFQLISAP